MGILDKETINGIFYQGGMELPLNRSKTIKTIPGDTSLPSSKETLEKASIL